MCYHDRNFKVEISDCEIMVCIKLGCHIEFKACA